MKGGGVAGQGSAEEVLAGSSQIPTMNCRGAGRIFGTTAQQDPARSTPKYLCCTLLSAWTERGKEVVRNGRALAMTVHAADRVSVAHDDLWAEGCAAAEENAV